MQHKLEELNQVHEKQVEVEIVTVESQTFNFVVRQVQEELMLNTPKDAAVTIILKQTTKGATAREVGWRVLHPGSRAAEVHSSTDKQVNWYEGWHEGFSLAAGQQVAVQPSFDPRQKQKQLAAEVEAAKLAAEAEAAEKHASEIRQ